MEVKKPNMGTAKKQDDGVVYGPNNPRYSVVKQEGEFRTTYNIYDAKNKRNVLIKDKSRDIEFNSPFAADEKCKELNNKPPKPKKYKAPSSKSSTSRRRY
jgi:hypothetical protein